MKKKKKLKKNNQAAAYCLSCKPEDFFYAGESTMGLNKSEIEKALAAAKLVCKWGGVAQAMFAVCKIAEGYRQYEKQVSEIAKNAPYATMFRNVHRLEPVFSMESASNRTDGEEQNT